MFEKKTGLKIICTNLKSALYAWRFNYNFVAKIYLWSKYIFNT